MLEQLNAITRSRLFGTISMLSLGALLAAGAWQILGVVAAETASPDRLEEAGVESARLAFPGHASEFQESLIADNMVTDEEHALAFEEYVGCMRDAGLVVFLPGDPGMAGGDAAYGYGAPRDRPDLVGSEDDLAGGCYDEFFSRVDYAYAAQGAMTAAEVADYQEELAACLNAHGADVGQELSSDEWVRWIESGENQRSIGRDCVTSTSP